MNAAALALSVNDLALGFSVLLGFSPSDPGFFSSTLVLGGGGELGLGGGATFPVMAVTPATTEVVLRHSQVTIKHFRGSS